MGFTVHTGAEGFWARRARTSIDVLGPGVLVGRVAGFGVSKEQDAADWFKRREAKGDSIRTRYLTCYANCYVDLICYPNCYEKCYIIYQNLGVNMLE